MTFAQLQKALSHQFSFSVNMRSLANVAGSYSKLELNISFYTKYA